MKPFLWHMKIHLPPVKTWYLRLLKAAKLSYLWTKLDTLTYYLRIGRLGLPVSLIEKSKLNYRYGVYRITLAIVGWDRGHSVRFLGTMKIKFYWKNISTIVIFEKKKFQIMCHMIGLHHSHLCFLFLLQVDKNVISKRILLLKCIILITKLISKTYR